VFRNDPRAERRSLLWGMSEVEVLALVARWPHPVALARHVRDSTLFPVLRRLEGRGFLWRQRDEYRLTRSGRDELALTVALIRLRPHES
jgi:DNA-binding MarR family transcriptional regulator